MATLSSLKPQAWGCRVCAAKNPNPEQPSWCCRSPKPETTKLMLLGPNLELYRYLLRARLELLRLSHLRSHLGCHLGTASSTAWNARVLSFQTLPGISLFSRTGLALAHGSNSAGLLCFCDHGSSFTQHFMLRQAYGLPCCCSLREPTGIVVFLRLEYDFRRSSVPEHAFRLIMARGLEH